ncbi:DUF2993 domain-containing protein [Altericista sp. CCNU0014]|uniref:LmeA family phospholipid-binding protein n=1 Tax=Altericista sp. CCNU0014 TaxID=3082949 RepID=UPI00384FA74A
MESNKPDVGERALNKMAEVAISSQLDEVENIDIAISTDPVKLVQGKVDSVAISGQGLVMKQDLRMETLEVNIVQSCSLASFFIGSTTSRPC